MIAILLRFWPYIVSAIAIIGLLLLVNHWRVEAGKVEGLELVIKSCNEQLVLEREAAKKNKEITKEGNELYESEIIKRDAELKRVRKRPAYCVPVRIAGTTNSGNAANQPNKPDSTNGISDSKFYDFASECDTDRIKVITLQNFITKVWANNNQ